MDKVRFACPRCRTIMQTGADKVGYDVACPHCAHRFKIVESESANSSSSPAAGSIGSGDATTVPPRQSPIAGTSPGASSQFPPMVAPKPVGQMPSPGSYSAGSYSCPYCHTTSPPIWKSEVSTIGWIVFAILLCSTCFLCFIGLFIRDRYRVCSQMPSSFGLRLIRPFI